MTDSNRPADEVTYRKSDQADGTLAGDRAVIYHRGTGNAITLNRAGTVLWQRLEQGANRSELQMAVRAAWPSVGEETAEADVDAFLAELMQQGLCEADTVQK